MTHICHLSGGVASWLATRRVVDRFGAENCLLIFADTLSEEASTYIFLDEAVKNLGSPYIRLCDGRNPWEVFADVKFLGNSRVDPCSRVLKRELIKSYVKSNFTESNCIQYFGFDATERGRLNDLRKRYDPWPVDALLCEPPYLQKHEIIQEAMKAGLSIPTMYWFGFSHNNCAGECVKAGQAHFKLLLEVLPENYAHAEAKEEELRRQLGDVSILRDRRRGKSRPMSLKEFRLRVTNTGEYDVNDKGGCSCFMSAEDEE